MSKCPDCIKKSVCEDCGKSFVLESTFFQTLKNRFENPPSHYKRPENIKLEDMKRAIEANPKALASLEWMEETGGAPDIIAVEGDNFVFADCSAESPTGRRNLDYDQSARMAGAFGVELMDEATYRKIQEAGKFDLDSASWLNTPEDVLKSGDALYGFRCDGGVHVYLYDAQFHRASRGFRCTLRVNFVL